MRVQRHAVQTGGGLRVVKLAGLWFTISLVAGGFGVAAYTIRNQPPDPLERCMRDSRLGSSTVVLVDTTDPLDDIQQRRVKTTIEGERDSLPRGGKLSIMTINAANPGEPVEWVSACNPGQTSDSNPLFVTESKVEAEWQHAFAGPIDAAIAQSRDAAGAATSPIIATVAAILTRPDFDARVPQRRLVLISDMLEHQKGGYSQLAGGDFAKAYRASVLAHIASLDLRGVSVAIDYLARPKYARVQGDAHRRFWLHLFTEDGARDVTFIGLAPPGDAVTADNQEPKTSQSLKKKGKRK